MLIPLISQYLRSHKRLVVPQLGAFIVKEPERCVLFSELLKRDDGVLRSLLTAGGMGDVEAAGEIDRFVFEVRHAVAHGGEYRLAGFGMMRPGPNGTIAFDYDPQPEPAESDSAAAAGSGIADPSETAARSEHAATSASAQSPAAAKQPSAAAPTAASSDPTQPVRASYADTASALGNDSGTSSSAVATDSAATDSGASLSAAATNGPAGPKSSRQHAVRQTYVEPCITPSAKLNPEPYVRGLRYGKPRKSTDAYRYVDAPPRRRRTDRFLLVALIAAVVAIAAIAFGYYREARERRAEAEFIEQLQAPAAQPHANEPNPTE